MHGLMIPIVWLDLLPPDIPMHSPTPAWLDLLPSDTPMHSPAPAWLDLLPPDTPMHSPAPAWLDLLPRHARVQAPVPDLAPGRCLRGQESDRRDQIQTDQECL